MDKKKTYFRHKLTTAEISSLKTTRIMENKKTTFQIGMELGEKHYSILKTKKQRWLSRNTPKWMIDNNLFVPFYITKRDELEYLYIIQVPIHQKEKVHFINFAKRDPTSYILNSTQ